MRPTRFQVIKNINYSTVSVFCLLLFFSACITGEISGENNDFSEDSTEDLEPLVCSAFPPPSPVTGCTPTTLTPEGEALEIQTSGNVTIFKNLTFAKRGGFALQGDLYAPTIIDDRKPGTLVLLHGGGWQECNRRRNVTFLSFYSQVLSSVLQVAVFNVEYRLISEGGSYPENVGDVKCAVKWMHHAGAFFGLDPGRVAIAGESAGGHLAAMVGVTQNRSDLDPLDCGGTVPANTSSTVESVISYSGAFDLPALANSGSPAFEAPIRYAGPCQRSVDVCRAGRICNRCIDASPIAHTCQNSLPRFALIHSHPLYDLFVPFSQPLSMRDALSDAGADVTLFVPTEEQLLAEGCLPLHFANQAHGLGNTCLTTPSSPVVNSLLLDTIGPE